MISIDGSMGEGGGQVLRSGLALSMVTGRPFRIENIRAGRSKPGLLRQHLTSVEAARAVCSGGVIGAELGSSAIEFTPGTVRAGEYSFAIGTAGSTTLVLQTVLPALITADGTSTITLSGGTHSPYAPTVDFLRHAFAPILERMGARVDIELERHGFYPAGGGRVKARIEPSRRLKPIELLEAEPVTARRAIATVAGLPGSIAWRELGVVRDMLGWPQECLRVDEVSERMGPGNVLSIEIERGSITEGFTGFGQRRVSAESVAEKAITEANRYMNADVPVWTHLADQLMVPMAIAGGGSYRTCELSPHATTNAEVVETFLDARVHRAADGNGTQRVTIIG